MSGKAKKAAAPRPGRNRSLVLGAVAGVCLLASGALLYSNIRAAPGEGFVTDTGVGAPAAREIVYDEDVGEDEAGAILGDEGEKFAEDYTRRIAPDEPSAIPGPGGKMPASEYDSPQ